MVWQKNGTPETLSGASDDCEITDLVATLFNFALFHKLGTANSTGAFQFGSTTFDTGSNYAYRRNTNGSENPAVGGQTNGGTVIPGTGNPAFTIGYVINIATEEKLFITQTVDQSTAGSGSAPSRREAVGKWANTAVQFDRMKMIQVDSGDFSINTNLSALGTD